MKIYYTRVNNPSPPPTTNKSNKASPSNIKHLDFGIPKVDNKAPLLLLNS